MSKRSKVAVIIAMVAIVLGVGAFYLVSSSFISTQSFASSFQDIVDETGLLAHDYDTQVQKWERGDLSNETMASITDTYLPKYQALINRTNDLQTPAGYENVTSLYARSIESELKSSIQFREYLLTGNKTGSEASMQSLSDAFRYEMESFKAFNSAANATNK
jgi:hypothetical protein